ncbi:MAG: NIPSNAP family protein [Ignavibacteria bacterium]
MFFELRQYRLKPGTRDKWIKLMEEEIIPFQTSKGIEVVASFIDLEDPDLYIWIRKFKNDEEKERLYKAVYESAEWLDVIKPKSDEIILRKEIKVNKIEATSASLLK